MYEGEIALLELISKKYNFSRYTAPWGSLKRQNLWSTKAESSWSLRVPVVLILEMY